MPKSFTEAEKKFIRDRLLQETEACLAIYGIRKTTVDELVRRVKIPKGTFYLFYDSKEALIFDVILKLNSQIQSKLLETVKAMEEKPNVDQLTELLFKLYQSLDNSFLLKLVENGELERYLHKAPQEFLELNTAEDDFMVGKLLSLFPNTDTDKISLYSGALRAIFLMPLYKDKIAADQFDEILKLMIRGVVLQMFGGQA